MRIGSLFLLRAAPVVVITALLWTLATAHPGSGILVDRAGQIYFLDTGSGLWRIDTRGALAHLSPLKNHWIAMDPNDRFTRSSIPTDPGRDWVITPAGSNPTLLISTDFPLVIGEDGNLYYPSVREANARMLRTDPTGRTTTLATLPRTAAGEAVRWINGITAGPDGSVYYTEDAAIKRIDRRGTVTTGATVAALTRGPSIPGNEKHPYLRGLKVDANGVMYVADSGDARVLKIAPDGMTTTLVHLESPWAPTDVALFGDVVYVLEFLHTPGDERLEWMPRIRKIAADGTSRVIMTVDKMPGARPARAERTVLKETSWVDYLGVLLRSMLAMI
jgi:sugar lactone lactonase YvrE